MAAVKKIDKDAVERFRQKTLRIQEFAGLINPFDTEADKRERRLRLEKTYAGWFEYYFPDYAEVPCAWFHKKLATDLLSAIEIAILLEIYRSGAKSVHADLGVPLFLMVKGQLRYMLLVGETEEKACELLGDIQANLQFNERFMHDYGEKFKYGDWSKGNFTTTDGVKFKSLGIGQSPRGVRKGARRPDYIVVDDVDNPEHVNNDRLMRRYVDWITDSLWGCFDSRDGAIQRFVFANNNFHKSSITNRLKLLFAQKIKEAKEQGRKSRYRILSVKAVKDLATFEPEWPEKTSADYWRSMFFDKPYRSFMREYMHTHIEDGNIFKYEHLRWKKMLPLDKYEQLMLYGDLSYKDQADYKALLLVGKIGKEFHVIHSFVRRASRKMAAEWLYDLYERRKLQKYNIRYLIEGLFAQDEFVGDFDAEGEQRGYYVPVVADREPKGSKYDRVESMGGHFERGNVYFNEEERDQPDQSTLIDQLLAFEKGSKANDDGPDCLQSAIAKLNKPAIHKNPPTWGFEYRNNRY